MPRSAWTNATTAVLVLAAAAHAAPGDPSPLAQVPASAVLVIHMNGPDALENHVTAFLKNAGFEQQVAPAKANLEAMFQSGPFIGRKVVGLVRGGHIFVAFMDAKVAVETPAVAILVPVTSYKDFRDNLLAIEERKAIKFETGYESATLEGKPAFFVDRKDYAVLAMTKEVAELFAKGPPGLDGKLNKDQADRFLKSDLGAYVDAEAFKKEYADGVKDAHKQFNDFLDQTKKVADNLQKAQLEVVRTAADGLFQALDDSPSALATGELSAGGASLHVEAALKSGSLSALALKDAKPAAFRDLTRTPAGQVLYTAWQTGPLLSQLLGPLQFGAVIDPDSKEAKAAGEAVDALIDAKPSSRLQALSVPPAGVEAWQYESPEKAVAAQTKLLESLQPGDYYLYGPLKEKPEIKTKVVKYRGFDMTYAHVAFDLDKLLANVPDPTVRRPMTASLKKLLGEGVSFWFGSDGKVFVQATGKDWASAKKQLDQYFASDGAVGKDESFADVRKELPAETSALALIDVVQYAGLLLEFFRPMMEATAGPGMKVPPPLKGKPAFAGAALTLRPERIDADVYVSADAVRQLVKGLPGMFPF